jgi:hypothetical protein
MARVELGARLFCWANPQAGRIGDRDVGKLGPRRGALEEHPTPRHISVTQKFLWKYQSIPEDRQEHVYVFSRSNASEEHNLAFLSNPLGDLARVALERVPIP